MLTVFFKKVFYESWDNFHKLILINIPAVLMLLPIIYIVFFAFSFPAFAIPFVFVVVFLINLYFGVVSGSTAALLQNDGLTFEKYLSFFKISIKPAFLISVVSSAVIIAFSFAIPFYMKLSVFLGFLASSVIFWASVLWLFSSQYYWPLFYLLHDNRDNIVKKSFGIFFDNKRFTLMLGLLVSAYLILSVFTAFIFPGFAFISYFQQCGVKLLLKKYEYLKKFKVEERASVKEIPWKDILESEIQDVENRTLRGLIFPWKE